MHYAAKIFLMIVFLSAWLVTQFAAYAAGKSDMEKAGDWLAFALPAFAGISTSFAGAPDGSMWDREGIFQVMKSIGFTSLTTHTLKLEKCATPSFG